MSERIDKQINFATVADPAFWELDEADFDGVTANMYGAANPERLRNGLIGVKYSHDSSLAYEIRPNVTMRVGLDPDEYTMIHRAMDPKYSRRYARNLTRAARSRLTDDEGNVLEEKRPLDQEDLEAVERAGIHIVEHKKASMERYVGGTLVPQMTRIERVSEYADHPTLRRRKESGMRSEIGWVKDDLFGGMLAVIGVGRDWNESQAEAAAKTVTWRLFFDRDENRHIDYWRRMMGLGYRHIERKVELFGDRIDRLAADLEKE